MGTWQQNSTLVGRTQIPKVAEKPRRSSHLRSVTHCSARGSLTSGTAQAIATGLRGSQMSPGTGQQSCLIGGFAHYPFSQPPTPIELAKPFFVLRWATSDEFQISPLSLLLVSDAARSALALYLRASAAGATRLGHTITSFIVCMPAMVKA